MKFSQVGDSGEGIRPDPINELAAAIVACPQPARLALCLGAIDVEVARWPRLDVFGDIYSDARLWAVAASDEHLVLHFGAVTAEMEGRQLAESRRRRALGLCWGSISPRDREDFLRRVTQRGAR